MWQVITESLEASVSIMIEETNYREVRDLLGLFIETMRMLCCDPREIIVLTQKCAYYYCDVLLDSVSLRLEEALRVDPLTPMSIQSEDEKEELRETLDYWLAEPRKPTDTAYPRMLPFSASVPKTISLVKDYITGLASIWRDIKLEPEDAKEKTVALAKYFLEHETRQLLSQRLAAVTGPGAEMQCTQWYSNLRFLEEAVPGVEKYLADEVWLPRQGRWSSRGILYLHLITWILFGGCAWGLLKAVKVWVKMKLTHGTHTNKEFFNF